MRLMVPQIVRLTCFLPFAVLLFASITNRLGPDPADTLAIRTGEWSLRFLLLSLAVTPLRRAFGWGAIGIYRRMFGLFSLLYASIHFAVYLAFLLQFRWYEIVEDILERPYITIGFASFCILLILGATSSQRMVKLLGRKWKVLHKSVYAASVLAIVHLLWILRSDIAEAVMYVMILLPILGYRVWLYLSR